MLIDKQSVFLQTQCSDQSFASEKQKIKLDFAFIALCVRKSILSLKLSGNFYSVPGIYVIL